MKFVQQGSFASCSNQLIFRLSSLRSCWIHAVRLTSRNALLRRLSCNDDSTKDQEGFRSPGETPTSALLCMKVSLPAENREKKWFSLRRTQHAGCSFRLKCCLLLIRLCACPAATPRLFQRSLSQCLDRGLTPVLHPDVTFLALLLHLSSSVGAPPSRRWLSSMRGVLALND